MLLQPFASFRNHCWIQTGVTVWKPQICVAISNFFVPRVLEISWMALKNNRAPPLSYFKLCVSFCSNLWTQTGVKSPETKFMSKSAIFCPMQPWKTIGHLSWTTSSFVHSFITIGELKLDLQSRSTQFGSKFAIIYLLWPWNLTDDNEKQ